jgi:hypothetical protein
LSQLPLQRLTKPGFHIGADGDQFSIAS